MRREGGVKIALFEDPRITALKFCNAKIYVYINFTIEMDIASICAPLYASSPSALVTFKIDINH